MSLTNKFRVVYRINGSPLDGRYTLQRKSIFGWWRYDNSDGKVYHFEHFLHGNDYDTYYTKVEAELKIREILNNEKYKRLIKIIKHKWNMID